MSKKFDETAKKAIEALTASAENLKNMNNTLRETVDKREEALRNYNNTKTVGAK